MEEIHRQRIKRLQQNMAEQGVDAFLILTSADYFYFTGDVRRQPRALVSRDGELVLLTFASEVEEAREATGLSEIIPLWYMRLFVPRTKQPSRLGAQEATVGAPIITPPRSSQPYSLAICSPPADVAQQKLPLS